MATTYQNLGYNKVFVALDGSEQQTEVLDRAIIVAANNNAELYIGHVIDSTALETAGSYPTSLLSSLEAAFRDSIAEQVSKAEHEPQIKKEASVVCVTRG